MLNMPRNHVYAPLFRLAVFQTQSYAAVKHVEVYASRLHSNDLNNKEKGASLYQRPDYGTLRLQIDRSHHESHLTFPTTLIVLFVSLAEEEYHELEFCCDTI